MKNLSKATLVSKKNIVIGITVAVALTFLGSLYFKETPKPEETPHLVEVEVVQPGNLSKVVRLSGVIEPIKMTLFKARSSGVMEQPLVMEGVPVAKGTLLVEIENDKLKRQEAYAKEKAHLANEHYLRQKKLAASRTKSQRSLDQAHDAWLASKISHERARTELAKTTFVAPYDGMCGVFQSRAGQRVSEGDAIVSFYDTSSYSLKIDVPSSFVSKVKAGSQFLLGAQQGQIVSVQGLLDSATGMGIARATLPGPIQVPLGSRVTIALNLEKREKVLTLPRSALVFEGKKIFVYRAVDGNADKAYVTTGLEGNGRFEILDGLAAGDQVILRGQEHLWPTKKVAVKGEAVKPAEKEGTQ